jgi:glycosyltransferase involved in cell wall biosynthesis
LAGSDSRRTERPGGFGRFTLRWHNRKPMKLSVVLPVHNEAPLLAELYRRLREVLDGLHVAWEAIFVDDGSTDDSWAHVQMLAADDDRVRGIRLSRNFGHQIALTAGLTVAEGDAVITMDSDLQHPPEVITALVEQCLKGFDVVYAIRGAGDAESWFKIHSARLFYWLINKLTSLNLPRGGADFRCMSRRAVDAVLAMPERNRFLRGMTRWVGFEQTAIEYERGMRAAGRSKYTFRLMVHFASDAIAGFSAIPLRLANLLGFLVSGLGFVYLFYVLVIRIAGKAIPGWTSVTVAVLLLGGVQLVCLGIVGQYLGLMYDETKRRPLFFVADDTRGDDYRGLAPRVLASTIDDPNVRR